MLKITSHMYSPHSRYVLNPVFYLSPGWCSQTCFLALVSAPSLLFLDRPWGLIHPLATPGTGAGVLLSLACSAPAGLQGGCQGHRLHWDTLAASPLWRSPARSPPQHHKSLSFGCSCSLSCIHSRQGSMASSLEAICTLTCWLDLWHLLTKANPEASLLSTPCHINQTQQDIHVISQIPPKVDVVPSLVSDANLSLCSLLIWIFSIELQELINLSHAWLESAEHPAATGAADKAVTSRLYL